MVKLTIDRQPLLNTLVDAIDRGRDLVERVDTIVSIFTVGHHEDSGEVRILLILLNDQVSDHRGYLFNKDKFFVHMFTPICVLLIIYLINYSFAMSFPSSPRSSGFSSGLPDR